MKRYVVEMHFVCRRDLNVVDHGNGEFDSGFWKVAESHLRRGILVALHESKAAASYRQGEVTSWQRDAAGRVTFRLKETPAPLAWRGDGSGEKGYAWSDNA